MSDAPFPSLPPELIYKICEFAGHEDIQTARSIAQISKSLLRVIDPIIHSKFYVTNYGDYTRFLAILQGNRIEDRRPASAHVRTLYIDFAYARIDDIIRACEQLERLAVYVWHYPMDIELPLPAPTEICILYDTAIVDLRSPLLRGVTHLNVGRAPPSLPDLDVLYSCRHLTHFGFHFRDRTESVDETTETVQRLLDWPQLKVICVEVSMANALPDHGRTTSIWTRLSAFKDKRLRVIPSLLVGTPDVQRQHWLMGRSIWDQLKRR